MKKKKVLKILAWLILFPFMLTYWGWKKENKPVIIIGVFLSILFLLIGASSSDDPSLNDEIVNENVVKVSSPSSSTYFKEKHYKEVIAEFEEAGFMNIKTKQMDDLITGWLTKEGEVDSVLIDGKEDYSTKEEYSNDVKVIITYHTFPSDEEVHESEDGKAEVSNGNQEKEEVPENSNTRNISGYDADTNKTIMWGGIEFSFPSYFDVLEDGANDSWRMYYPNEDDYYASLLFESQEFNETQEYFNDNIEVFVDRILGSENFANKDILKSEGIQISGFSGWSISYIKSDDENKISKGITSFVYNDEAGKIILITCVFDSIDKSQYNYLGDYIRILENAKLPKKDIVAESIDLNAINNTNSDEADSQFIGRQYLISGEIYQAIDSVDRYGEAMIIIWPETMAKGMDSTLPLEINIWMSENSFKKIGGTSSEGENVEILAELISIRRNTENPSIKGYPIELEFREINR